MMVFPTVSVTVIGLLAAILAILLGGRPGPSLIRGFLGAWIGFTAGAVAGVLIDAILQTGVYLAVIGHVAAALGALVAGASSPRSITPVPEPSTEP
jgi:hypothetical protein